MHPYTVTHVQTMLHREKINTNAKPREARVQETSEHPIVKNKHDILHFMITCSGQGLVQLSLARDLYNFALASELTTFFLTFVFRREKKLSFYDNSLGPESCQLLSD